MVAAVMWLLLPGMPESSSSAGSQVGFFTILVQILNFAAKIVLEVSLIGLLMVAITGLVVK